MYTLIFAFCAFLCAWALERAHSRRARKLLADLPSYPQLPIIGNLLQATGGCEAIYRVTIDTSKIIEAHQKPFVFWLGPQPIIILSDPEDVKAINNTFIDKPYYYAFARIWLGDGLITAPGAIWKRNVKKLAGAYTQSVVDSYQEVFNAQAQKLVKDLKGEVGGAPFDISKKYLVFTALDAICQTAAGVTSISESIPTAEYYRAIIRTFELVTNRGLNPFIHPEWAYRLTPMYRELVKSIELLHNISDTVIQKRRKEFAELKQNGTYEDDKLETRPKFRSFLDILLELSETDPLMTEEQMRAEVDTIIISGQETVATTLLFVVVIIGSKPEVQDKLFAEIKSIFGESKRPVEKEDLARMTYCEAVINETLRLYPPVPMVMRNADHDLKLRSCTIPKDAACCVNVLGAGRSFRSWGPDAMEFKPERWLAGGPPKPASFLAFSYGRRDCIGKRYSMAIVKTVLAWCVRELEFVSEADKLRFKVDIKLRPISGHFVEVRLRQSP